MVPLKVWNKEKKDMTLDTKDKVFFLELVPLRSEQISSHAHKTASSNFLGVLFKISHNRPRGNPGRWDNVFSYKQTCMSIWGNSWLAECQMMSTNVKMLAIKAENL